MTEFQYWPGGRRAGGWRRAVESGGVAKGEGRRAKAAVKGWNASIGSSGLGARGGSRAAPGRPGPFGIPASQARSPAELEQMIRPRGREKRRDGMERKLKLKFVLFSDYIQKDYRAPLQCAVRSLTGF